MTYLAYILFSMCGLDNNEFPIFFFVFCMDKFAHKNELNQFNGDFSGWERQIYSSQNQQQQQQTTIAIQLYIVRHKWILSWTFGSLVPNRRNNRWCLVVITDYYDNNNNNNNCCYQNRIVSFFFSYVSVHHIIQIRSSILTLAGSVSYFLHPIMEQVSNFIQFFLFHKWTSVQ